MKPRQRRFGLASIIVVSAAIVVGMFAANLDPFRSLFDLLFNRHTYVATGDATLKQLRELKIFTAADASFSIPVVVCDGNPESFDKNEKPKKGDKRTPSQRLLEDCSGIGDEKATLIVDATVEAQIDLAKMSDDAVKVNGDQVTITLPKPALAPASVDAARDVLIVAIDSSILPGSLPDDYQSLAAAEAANTVDRLAQKSELVSRGERSARAFFTGLLKSIGFREIDIAFEPTKPPES